MLNISIDDFISLLTGVKVIVTEDDIETPQCVDPVQLYARILGAPRFSGNAQDIYNQPGDFFTQIANTPDNFPVKGDIVVLSDKFNGTDGHVGISIGKADINTCDLWEQNDPIGHDLQIKTYSYTNAYGEIQVLGWLRPKKQLPQSINLTTLTAINSIPTPSVSKKQIDYVISFLNTLIGK